MKNNVSKPGGLHTDHNPVDQPENTTRYALNAVDESSEGEISSLSNEESNEACYQLTPGYILLGDVYIGNGDTVLFSVAPDESSSEIGIADRDCNYTPVINADFGFKIGHQIDATYRLRRGCGRTVYWVDPKPRCVNLDDLKDYKDELGNWNLSAFDLMKTSSKIPKFESFEIQEQGEIPAGTVNFAVQYLDDDLNPTEWLTSSEVINIYHDRLSTDYSDIRGSSNVKTDFQNFGKTSKSVRLTLSNLDDEYPFYRVAIIRADAGNGLVTSVEYSQELPTDNPVYNYTGQGLTAGTLEEIQQFATIIDSAQHIEQLENKLLLHNVKGKQIDYCKLQKYASRIKADVVYKKVNLSSISESNPKSPTVRIEGVGYTPGEIESFGIVFVFDDGTTTPAYHIPGRNPNYPSEMSTDNQLQDVTYTENDSCANYWGYDSEGQPLTGQPVRHHRFPLRSEVNKPLFKRTSSVLSDSSSNNLYVHMHISDHRTPRYFTDNESFTLKIVYEKDGVEETYTKTIYKDTIPLRGNVSFLIAEGEEGNVFETTGIYENDLDASNGSNFDGIVYDITQNSEVVELEEANYETEVFGIEFSGIEKPSTKETGGHEIVGYYIVKNERTDEHKTILDSGIITPLTEEEYFVAHGHLAPNLPDNTRIKKDAFGLIHPEHKFLGKEYKNTAELLHEGDFTVNSSISQLITRDVQAGTTYDPEVHKNDAEDNDGFDLNLLIRDSSTKFTPKGGKFLAEGEIKDMFYLDSLSSKTITDVNDRRKEVFNVSGDNKVGIVQSTVSKELGLNTLPYVVMRRNLASPYANFRYLPYYKQSPNINLFQEGQASSTTVFAGDSYVGPMRYSNTFYYNTKPLNREQKSSFWNYVVGGLAIIAGAAITVFTGGIATALGVMVAGFGLTQISAGIKKDKIIRVYNQLYDEGLRDCVEDNNTIEHFPWAGTNKELETTQTQYLQSDDEIDWVGESITNLWFESSVNLSLRQGVTIGLPDFLNTPEKLTRHRDYSATRDGYNSDGTAEMGSNDRNTTYTAPDNEPQNMLQDYFLEKLTVLDPDAQDGRLYQGFANAEIYEINKDYFRKNKEKIYNHLGLEYDCCSDCNEVFPHRTHWSETSFQEELTDNYRMFLPNNYRDIEAEKGEITAVHKIQNNLYIHTTEALWHLPQNFQERITGDILSFIGTGEFFNVPPKKVVDSDKSSAGTRHKWGCIKTKHGILFPSVDDRKWYLFTGNDLEPIADIGNSAWFNNHMSFTAEQQYYNVNKKPYPYADNPSSPFGIGYLSTYDDEKERLIVSKKDFSLSPELLAGNFGINQDNGLVVFKQQQDTINGYVNEGYTYEGEENGRMVFSKEILDRVIEQRKFSSVIPSSTDLHFFYDTSGSFGAYDGPDLTSIRDAVAQWVADFRASNPDWVGNVYEYQDATERWLAYAETIAQTTYAGENLAEKDIIVVSFCNESSPYGNGSGLQSAIASPTASYTEDYEDFKVLHSQYKSFKGIHYPIVFESGTYSNPGKALVQQSLAAIKGTSFLTDEVNAIEYNEAFTKAEWETLKTSLKGANPYPDDGLENYGWTGKWHRNNIDSIINASDFAADINGLLSGTEVTEYKDVEVQKSRVVYDYVSGEPLSKEDFIEHDNSWTMSFSLKRKQWRSWHSYTPDYFLSTPGKFYSWITEDDNIWKHNVTGHYQTFYGQMYPHVIEYVSVSTPIQNRIWDSLMFQTNASQYMADVNEFVDKRLITFNKLLVYNTRQISGVLDMVVKDSNPVTEDYLLQQVYNDSNEVILDNTEGDWYVNGFRDMRDDFSQPMFKKDLASLQLTDFTDKCVNDTVINFEKDWDQMESFRDKYLVIRLIFDNFDNIKLITNYLLETEDISGR